MTDKGSISLGSMKWRKRDGILGTNILQSWGFFTEFLLDASINRHKYVKHVLNFEITVKNEMVSKVSRPGGKIDIGAQCGIRFCETILCHERS